MAHKRGYVSNTLVNFKPPLLIRTTSTMFTTPASQDGSRRLHCLIEGESVVFTVEESCRIEIGDLKEVIQCKALGTLKDVDPHTLELWKVSAINESQVTWLTPTPQQVNIDLDTQDRHSLSLLNHEDL